MASAGPLGVVGVDRVLHVAAFVERIGVNGHLHVVAVGDVERHPDRLGGRAPVLVNLETADSRLDLLRNGMRHRAVALAQHADVDRHPLDGLQHPLDIPHARGDGRTVGAVRRAHAAAEEGRDAVREGCLRLLRRDIVDVAVDAGRRQNQMLARNGIGRGARHQIGMHPVHGVRITGLADAGDLAVLDAHVGLHHAQHRVDDRYIGNHEIERSLAGVHAVGQSHAVAQRLAAAVDHLVAVFAEVFLDLDVQVGVAEPDLVAHRGAEKVVINLSGYRCHSSYFFSAFFFCFCSCS